MRFVRRQWIASLLSWLRPDAAVGVSGALLPV
jgi:hypothetical protein